MTAFTTDQWMILLWSSCSACSWAWRSWPARNGSSATATRSSGARRPRPRAAPSCAAEHDELQSLRGPRRRPVTRPRKRDDKPRRRSRLLQRRLRRREPGDRHAVGRGADIIEADALAEGDAGRIAAMLAANAELEVRPGRPAALDRDRDQLADALDVDADEGVAGEDALLDIGAEEAAGIVAADAQGGLGEIVGAEAEEFAPPRRCRRRAARRGAARSSCRPDSRSARLARRTPLRRCARSAP